MRSVKNTVSPRGVYNGPYITIYYLVNQKTYSEPHQHKQITIIINDNNDNGSNNINDDNNDDNHISLIS